MTPDNVLDGTSPSKTTPRDVLYHTLVLVPLNEDSDQLYIIKTPLRHPISFSLCDVPWVFVLVVHSNLNYF